MKRAKLRLSRLRDIGWSEWDPIGILNKGDIWDHKPFADEYDSYLIQAAGQLRRGVNPDEVLRYLIDIERDYMGLGMQRDTIERAKKVIKCIQDDSKLWNENP